MKSSFFEWGDFGHHRHGKQILVWTESIGEGRTIDMRQSSLTQIAHTGVILALAALVSTGCGNPADGVQEANVAEPSGPGAPETTGAKVYQVSSDSTVHFTGSKVTGSQNGGFREFTGTIAVKDDQIVSPSEIVIDMESTWTESGDRLTNHLKNADFFDVPNYPTSRFVVTGVEPSGDGHKVTGDMTLRGVTKSISFDAEVSVSDSGVTLRAEFFIKRFDFGVAFKGKADDLIRDEVVLKLEIKASA